MAMKYRTVWISDVHLGTKGCKADELLEFLNHVDCENLYLVGDIIDLWKFRSGLYWPELHNEIVRCVINKAKQGVRVTYIPGNHDELFRKYTDIHFNGIDIQLNTIHETIDGRKFLVQHGDEFDSIVCHNKSLAYIGGELYEVLLLVNRWFNACRSLLGYKYWSLSKYLKYKVKNAVKFINNYQHILSLEAQKKGVDGIICGHIHHADISEMEFQKTYCNCGDWVESCTALIEDFNGRMSIIHWLEDRERLLGLNEEKVSNLPRAA